MARYRKIHVPMYADGKFTSLSKPQPNAQSLWMYILTGPHTSIIPGLSCIGAAALAESLDWEPEAFRKAFLEISSKGMARADWKARILWVPNAVKYNPPESPNVVKAWASYWAEVPECELKLHIYQELKAFVDGMGDGFQEAFRKAFGKPLPKTMPNQEQEQEQEQEEYIAAAPPAVSPKPRKKPSGEHHALIEYWCKAWETKYGKPFPFDAQPGKNAKHIQTLLASLGYAESTAAVDRYLANDDKFFKGHSLGMLVSQIPKFMTDGSSVNNGDPDNFVAVRPTVEELNELRSRGGY